MNTGDDALVDAHCHLTILDERGLLDAALQSCTDAEVCQVVSPGLNVEDSDHSRKLSEAYPGVFFGVGWHPHEPHVPDPAQLRALDSLLEHPRAVAVGEIGLDLYFRPGYHETPLEVQVAGLHAMFELAETHSKPVILHDRDAHSQILDVMRAHPGVSGVMHCFSGDAGFAKQCVALGYVISFSGTITFNRSESIQAALQTLGDTEFTVETDAPFLAPVPYRGKANLPGYVATTTAEVARLRNSDIDITRRLATATAQRLFALPGDDMLR